MEVGGAVDQPLVAGLRGADVKLGTFTNGVSVIFPVVQIIEDSWDTCAGVARDHDEVLGVGSRQFVRLVRRGVDARVAHGLRVNRPVFHPAGLLIEAATDVDVRDDKLQRGARVDRWEILGLHYPGGDLVRDYHFLGAGRHRYRGRTECHRHESFAHFATLR